MNSLPVQRIDYRDPGTVETIRQTIAIDATDSELKMFIAFCESTGLNPFKKEIWFIKTKGYTTRDGRTVPGRVQMMTGINGFFQIANSHPQYNGMEEPEYTEEGGKPVRCVVRVHRKDRAHPSVGVARWAEFFPGKTDKGNSLWETKPFHMLAKVAKAIALREAFPQELNGLYTEDEMSEPEVIDAPAHPLDSVPAPKARPAARPNQKPTETALQAETRELIDAGKTWVYGPGFIEVEGAERKALWARLVRDCGAVTDGEGVIHTCKEAHEIAYALVGKPGRVMIEGVTNEAAV